jgi:CBS-domain-containing membrane protein
MHSPPICVSENAQLKHAARLLVVEHIGSLPVLNARKVLVGIITETDIFKVTAGMLRARPAAKTPPKKKAAKKAAGKATGASAKKSVKAGAARKAPATRKSAKGPVAKGK